MRIQWLCQAAFFVACAFTAAHAPALSGPMGNSEPITSNQLPEQLVELLNSTPRVYGFRGTDIGLSCYYQGNAEQLNAFILACAAIDGFEGEIVLSPDPGVVLTRTNNPADMQKPLSYNWSLSHRPRTFQGVTGDQENGQPPLVVIVIHVSGGIKADDLLIPLHFKAEFHSDLTKLVATHNHRRSNNPKDEAPTSTADLPSSVFADWTEDVSPNGTEASVESDDVGGSNRAEDSTLESQEK